MGRKQQNPLPRHSIDQQKSTWRAQRREWEIEEEATSLKGCKKQLSTINNHEQKL
jgi:hypothetical protein